MVGALAAGAAVLGAALAPLAGGWPAGAVRHPDERALAEAGWTRGVRTWCLVQSGVLLGAAVICVALGLPFVLTVPVSLAPSVWIRLRAEGARDRSRRALGPIVLAAEGALRSGMSLPDALRRAADASPDAAAAESLRGAVRSFDLGAGLDEALSAAATRASDERASVALATLALGIGERLPRERAADLLASLGDRIAFEDGLAEEVRARSSGARQQQRLLAALVPGLALYLVVTMPMLAATLSSELGRFVLLPAAVLLEVAGVVLGRRIVRDALA